ncbi:hypothetical protein CUZ98_2334 [Enterococcus faecium]|nr:hypothetical protein [Enterococcus faecium]
MSNSFWIFSNFKIKRFFTKFAERKRLKYYMGYLSKIVDL